MPVTAATTTKTTTSFNEKSKQAAGPDINGLLFTHSHIQSHSLTSICKPYAVWNTLIITLNAWLSRSLTQAQTQAQSQSQTQSAITNRILLVARRKRLTTRKCLTV